MSAPHPAYMRGLITATDAVEGVRLALDSVAEQSDEGTTVISGYFVGHMTAMLKCALEDLNYYLDAVEDDTDEGDSK